MKKKSREEDEGLFFVYLTENEKIRRDVLENLKKLLEFSHGYERMKAIRHQKAERLNKMKSILREINRLVLDLRQKIPQANIRLPSVKSEPSEKPQAQKRAVSELDRLNSELRAVEEKLSRLG